MLDLSIELDAFFAHGAARQNYYLPHYYDLAVNWLPGEGMTSPERSPHERSPGAFCTPGPPCQHRAQTTTGMTIA